MVIVVGTCISYYVTFSCAGNNTTWNISVTKCAKMYIFGGLAGSQAVIWYVHYMCLFYHINKKTSYSRVSGESNCIICNDLGNHSIVYQLHEIRDKKRPSCIQKHFRLDMTNKKGNRYNILYAKNPISSQRHFNDNFCELFMLE